jgi:hypothetical protein
LPASTLNLVERRAPSLRIAFSNHHAGAFLSKPDRNPLSDPSSRTGNDGYFTP